MSGSRSFSIKGFRVFSVFSCFIIFLNSKILFLIRDNPWTVRESAFVTHVFASILYIDALNICYKKLELARYAYIVTLLSKNKKYDTLKTTIFSLKSAH